MSDIGYDEVGLFDHPLIAPRDCKIEMDSLNAFWKHGDKSLSACQTYVRK